MFEPCPNWPFALDIGNVKGLDHKEKITPTRISVGIIFSMWLPGLDDVDNSKSLVKCVDFILDKYLYVMYTLHM